MDQATRNSLQNATQQARRLLEREITEQLEGTFDVLPNGTIADKAGKHLDASQRLVRTKIVESIRHRAGGSAKADMLADAVADYVREAAFTILNRYIALKMLEVRSLVQQCITKGDQSSGFKEFGLAATGLAQLPDKGYRLYLESLVDELSTEVKILFDRHSDASLLWPRRQAFDGLLEILNAEALATVWREDETIGWVYQYFNSDADREKARYDEKGKPKAPQNSYELAVRNQFFTPRYVVEFLTDNTLGRTWYEMRQGVTALTEKCRYLVRRPDEVFFSGLSVPNGTELEGPPLFAKFLAEPELGSLLPFAADRPQALIELAHCVDAYSRHPFGQEIEGQWWPWHMRGRMESATGMEEFSTQDILDVMFCQCRADRHGGGDGIADPVFIRLANEVRKRVINSREPDRAQQELLRDPVFVRFRPKKDPRDLKILDPACGSSHFLLYCFDLLLTIYAEAWGDEQSPPSHLTGKSLREDYSDEASLRLALPGLILRHNVHGIDIDPRCAQIGAFALWMRAQRAYNEFNIPNGKRPPITKSNIVVAEPMPGEDDLLTEFLRGLREDRLESLIRQALDVPPDKKVTATRAMADSLCDLVRTIWDQMKLAGEAGSLLRIDDELEQAIRSSRSEWHGKHALFRDAEFSLSEAQRDFWAGAESLVLHALRSFAQSVGQTAAASFRRGLFADDAARGLAFIDVSRVRMDVVLMNPPFGAAVGSTNALIERYFPAGKNDLFASFVQRGLSWLVLDGLLGAITNRTGFFRVFMEDWRSQVLRDTSCMQVFADLGSGVLDALVETAAYALRRSHPSEDYSFDCFRVIGAEDLGTSLASICEGRDPTRHYIMRLSDVQALPNRAMVYWLPPSMQRVIRASEVVGDSFACTKGLTTDDDSRFVRLWWEVQSTSIAPDGDWTWFAKGGEYATFFYDVHLVVRWQRSGEEMAASAEMREANVARTRQSSQYYFTPAVAFSRRTSRPLSARVLPAGCTFSDVTVVCIDADRSTTRYLGLLGYLNSEIGAFFTGAFTAAADTAARSYESGTVAQLPMPECVLRDETLHRMVHECWQSVALCRAVEETCYLFAPSSPEAVTAALASYRSLMTQINERVRAAFGGEVEVEPVHTLLADSATGLDDVEFDGLRDVSYWLGVAFGRWCDDATRAIGRLRQLDPFAAWPRLPLATEASSVKYPVMLVDEREHALDIVQHILVAAERTHLRRAPGMDLDDEHLRELVRQRLFERHIKDYSKSRRKAPIYWQLGVPSGRYSVWLYGHRVSKDRLFQALKEVLQPKLNQEEGVLGRLKQEAGASPTQGQRRAVESQEDFIAELKTLIDEVTHVAPLWAPNLDDGVVICLAPLWRLFPQNRSWQKECKQVWDDLLAGDYDWSHMAMHLWPERAVPKCLNDRSLAIAHGLEELFWVESRGRWRALRMPREEIEEQQRIRKQEASDRLLKAMVGLAKSNHAATPSRMLWQALKHGGLDDQAMALCLWPERVVERAAADGAVADRLEIKPADLATARARAALIVKYEVADLPSMLAAAEAAFGDDRDFKSLWAALAGGQHDDQPLALVLWPERVVEKCLKDFELADTHGLRGFFWFQDLATKEWRRRLTPEDEVKQEVQRRFNRTVKDALATFIEAPTAEGASSRRRRGSAAAAEVEAGARPTTQGKKRGRPRTVNTEEELF